MGSFLINILIHPATPSGQRSRVCFQNFKPGMYIITFLVIIFPVKSQGNILIGGLYKMEYELRSTIFYRDNGKN